MLDILAMTIVKNKRVLRYVGLIEPAFLMGCTHLRPVSWNVA